MMVPALPVLTVGRTTRLITTRVVALTTILAAAEIPAMEVALEVALAVAPMVATPVVAAPVVAAPVVAALVVAAPAVAAEDPAMAEAPRLPLVLVCLLSLPATPGSLRTTKRISSHGLRTMTSTAANSQNIAQPVSIKNTYKTQTLANIGSKL